jgi:hypothetical protein
MANINAPKGFSPVGNIQGGSWNQQGRLYAIPTTDTTNSYAVGDVVMSLASADADGIPFVQKWAGATTTSALPLGIIVGIRVADPGVSLVASSLDLTQSYISAGVRTAVRYIYVVDDPMVLFEAQFDATAIALTDLHKNAAVTVTTNQTLTQSAPMSSVVLTAPAVTATLPVRLLGLIQRPDNATGAYARVLCKWNYHEFGITAGASGSVVGYLAA